MLTLAWGVIAICISVLANQFGNLIEAVNHLGSIFYGPILGIFVSAFFFKALRGTAVFWGAIASELIILAFEFFPGWWPGSFGWMQVAYLWYNLIGCVSVVAIAFAIQGFRPKAAA
jgi:solute:Na+ symporter, SSS family